MSYQAKPTARPHLGGDVRRTVLPSGLRIVTEQMPGSHTFSLGWFIGIGSRHETAGIEGAAHYLEHVLFKGTKDHSAEELAAVFDRIGGEVNAYTAKEHTCFYCKVLADDSEAAVQTLFEMLTGSLINVEEFEQERTVILDEISMHADDPLDAAYAELSRHLYAGHPLGREVIGTKESIQAITRDEVANYWSQHYQTSTIVISAAGNVDHDWLVNRLSSWPANQADQLHNVLPKQCCDPTVITLHRPTEQCSCVLGFPGLAVFDPRKYALDCLGLILGGGMSSRLFVEVRERRGLAYHIDAGSTGFTDAGHFSVEWLSAPDVVAEILELVRDIICDVMHHGVSEEELARAKGQYRGQTLLAFESPDSRMMRLGRSELFGDTRSVSDILDHFEAVTVDDIRSIAREILHQPAALCVVGADCQRPALEELIHTWVQQVDPDLG